MTQVTHIPHIEDTIFDEGLEGIERSINTFLDILYNPKSNLQTKIDGSPSMVAGYDEDGVFFVSTKSFFNKVPVKFRSDYEIDRADIDAPLKKKLKYALQYLPILNIPKGFVVQGDFLFTEDDLLHIVHEDIEYTAFHPNAIIYGYPDGHSLDIARMGIFLHTFYDLIEGEWQVRQNRWDWVNFNQDDVFVTVPRVTKRTQLPQVSPWTTNKRIYRIGLAAGEIDRDWIKTFTSSEFLKSNAKMWINSLIRSGTPFNSIDTNMKAFYDFCDKRNQAEVDKLKTKAGKIARRQKFSDVEGMWAGSNMWNFFRVHLLITELKLLVINKLNSEKQLATFVYKNEELVVTGHEGYVHQDQMQPGFPVKLVDRYEFSFNNFSNEVAKGWKKWER